MADIESNIKVNIDTSDALSQLKLLQQQISAFQQAMKNAGAQNAAAAQAMQQNLMSSINATGKFTANIQTIKTSAESFTESLEKNKLSIGQYFKYAGGASKTFGKLFKSEFDTIEKVAVDRVKTIQTQYIKLGRDASGAMKAIAVRPLALDMDNLGTKTQIASQKQQLFNQLMKQGSTQLLNFGKNTQWAGRQLMVGFTIPLTLMGQAAAQAYMKIEAASLKFRRVYGDMNTTTEEANKMVKSVQALANEFTKYGIAVSDTMQMAADAAAMGKTGTDLMQQVAQASKLAVLGQVEQQQALETTISLTNAFGVSTDELAKSVDFLNAVENQTVVSIEDLTIAIPKAAPVVKQLGGDVEDLTFFLTAMKEGGINASEGANALKSGLASLINPTKKASDFLAGFGVNVKQIVEGNQGDIKGVVVDFAKALDTLDPLNRARAIEQMFGKFQFSRLSTLFKNVIDEGSQAATVAGLSKQTAEELAVLSEREMSKISDSPMFKFQKSIQDMQAKLAPVGEAFLKAVTPIIEFVTKILDGFNNLSEGTKSFVSILVLAVAGIGPALLMTFGLIANGVANIMKLFTNMKAFINRTTKPSDVLGEQTSYMNTEQLKSAAIAASLDQAHAKLRQTFTSEAAAVEQLTQAYKNAVNAQAAYSGIPGVPTGGNTATPKKYAGGVSMVPGPSGAGDIVPALLSPGEAVIPARSAKKYAPVIRGMIAGNLPGFEDGTPGAGMRQSIIGPMTQKQTEGIARTGKTLKDISDEVVAGPYGQVPVTNYGKQVSPSPGHSFPAFGVAGIYEKPDGSKVFVKPQMDLVSAMAEIRGTTIARDAHGLVAPNQALRVMMDPTDPDNKRKFLVLESALDDKISNIPTSFTKDQYFKQLVASLLRGDKDLGIGNLGGDVLADVGPAGVFQRASGKRQLGSQINSMEEQAIINLLGVKGGAKRFFAESTAEIAKNMSPAEYDAAMKAEIQRVAPKLQATIAGFGNLSPEEKQAYMAMQQRLQAGMGVDWARYQVMHSAVPPKKYAMGGIVPGYEDGTDSVKNMSWEKTQLTHLQAPWVKDNLFKIASTYKDGKIYQALTQTGLNQLAPEIQQMLQAEILGSLVSDTKGSLNQAMRPSQKKGQYDAISFLKEWNSNPDQLLSTILRSGTKISDPLVISSARNIQKEIGALAASKVGTGFVKDEHVSQATDEVLRKYISGADSNAIVAKSLVKQSEVLGEIRIRPDKKNSTITNLGQFLQQRFAAGDLAFGEGKPTEGLTQSVFLGRGKPFEVLPQGARGSALFRLAQLKTENRVKLLNKYGSAQAIAQAFATGQEKLTGGTQSSTLRGEFGYSTGKQETAAARIREIKRLLLDEIPDAPDDQQVAAMAEKFTRLAKGGIIPGYKDGTNEVLPQGFSAMPTQAEKDAQVAFIQNSPLAQLQRGDALASLVAKSTIGKGNQMFRVPTIRQNEELATKKVGDIIDIGNRFTSIADQSQLQAIGMTAAGKLNTGNRERAVNTILKLVAGYDMPGIMNHSSYNPGYKKDAFGDAAESYPFQSEGVLPPGLKGKITSISNGLPKIMEVLIMKLAKGGMIPGYANGVFSVPGPKGAGDVVPAMLSPGEAVIPAKQAAKHRPMIRQMIAGNLPGYAMGGIIPGYEDGIGNVPFGAPVKVIIVGDETKKVVESDPEEIKEVTEDNTGEQKKATEETKKTRKSLGEYAKSMFTRTQGTGQVQMGLYGVTSALGIASTMGGAVGQAAQQAMVPLGAAATAMSLIPGKAGLVVAAFTAVGSTIFMINEHLNKLRNEAMDLGTAMGSSSKSINKFAEFAKTVTGTQAMDKRREASAGQFFNVVQGKTTFGESYMKSEAGKELVKSVGAAIKGGGLDQAKSMIVSQLSTAIASGALSPAQARSIASNLGAQLGDMSLGIEVAGKITDLVGPKGENLKKEPLEIRMRLVADSVDQFKKQAGIANANASDVVKNSLMVGGGYAAGAGVGAGVGLATAGVAAGVMALAPATTGIIAATAALGSAVPVVGTIVGALVGAGIAIVQIQGDIAKNAGYLQASLGSALSVQQQMVDSLTVDYEKRIASAKAAGDIAEATRLQNQFLADQAELLQFNKEQTQEMYNILNNQATGFLGIGDAQTANVNTAREALIKAFEGTGQEVQAKLAQEQIDAMAGSSAQKTMLLSAVAQKQIGLNQVGVAQRAFGADQAGADALQALMENSPTELNRTLGLAGSMGAGEQKKFLVEMSLADPIEAKKMNDAVELAQKTTGVFFGEKKTAEAIMRFAVENPEKMLEFQQNVEDLKSAEKIDITVATKILGPNLAKALGEKSVGDYLQKYNKQNKVVFLSEFQQVMTMLQEGDKDMLVSYNKWNAENGFKKTYADYAAWQSDRTVTAQGVDNAKLPGEEGATGTATGPQASILDQFVQMARETSNFQQKLTTGWSASYAALKNYTVNSISLLAGWAVRLKQQGVSANMIDVFMGATEEEQDRIMDRRTGKLKAGAAILLKKLQTIQDQKEFGLSYVLASPSERMTKDNALYQAGLDVIANKEKKVNEKYDKRIKALDEIGKIQEKNNQRQQDTLTLADALSKGDIAAAARAAMTAKQNSQKLALEDAKESIELARKRELETVTTTILGKTVRRDELEAQIAVNSGKIAEHKRIELNRQIQIGKNAVIAADASARLLASGKLIAKLPGKNTPSGTGTDTGTDGKDDPTEETPTPTMSGVLGSLKNVSGVGRMTSRTLSSAYGKLISPTAQADFKANQGILAESAKDGINDLILNSTLSTVDQQNFGAALRDSDDAAIQKLRGKMTKGEKETFDRLYEDYNQAKSNLANPTEGLEAEKNTQFSKLPQEVQSAFLFLKQFGIDMKPLQTRVNNARTALKTFLENNPGELTDAEVKERAALKLEKTNAETALTKYKKKDDSLLARLKTLGYGDNARKLFAGYARGGMVYANRGLEVESSKYALGTDTIPAMLTAGEFVMKKAAVDRIGAETLTRMNDGTSSNESVYNYNITVNANSSDTSDIADAVLRQIKRVDSQRIRSSAI